jgi:hypothetical protein
MKELFVYGLVAASSLSMLTYTVHMFLGGVVSEETETKAMMGVAAVAMVVMGIMAWDVRRRRQARRQR